jgi:hypothetical protein
MYNPYRGEIFDRVVLYEKLHHFEDFDPEVISVGDSSGFFGIQSTIVNRYTKGARYLSLNTGANYAYLGYRPIAEYMLMRSSHLKYVVIYAFPQIVPVPYILGAADLAPIVYDTMVGPLSYLTPPSAFLSPNVKYMSRSTGIGFMPVMWEIMPFTASNWTTRSTKHLAGCPNLISGSIGLAASSRSCPINELICSRGSGYAKARRYTRRSTTSII